MDQKVESYISMNLHYSQTENETFFTGAKSYTSMNLHYSQTGGTPMIKLLLVLYLYEFTLLSNLFYRFAK